MDLVRTFGKMIEAQAEEHPARARAIMLAGWRAQLLKLRHFADKRLPPSRQYAGRVAMEKVTGALRHPERAAAMSLFVPYEPSEDAVRDMARQLRQMTGFVEDCTGVRVEEDALRAALARSWHAALDFRRFLMRRQGGDCPPI